MNYTGHAIANELLEQKINQEDEVEVRVGILGESLFECQKAA